MDSRTGMLLPLEDIPKGQKKHFVKVTRDLSAKERKEKEDRTLI